MATPLRLRRPTAAGSLPSRLHPRKFSMVSVMPGRYAVPSFFMGDQVLRHLSKPWHLLARPLSTLPASATDRTLRWAPLFVRSLTYSLRDSTCVGRSVDAASCISEAPPFPTQKRLSSPLTCSMDPVSSARSGLGHTGPQRTDRASGWPASRMGGGKRRGSCCADPHQLAHGLSCAACRDPSQERHVIQSSSDLWPVVPLAIRRTGRLGVRFPPG